MSENTRGNSVLGRDPRRGFVGLAISEIDAFFANHGLKPGRRNELLKPFFLNPGFTPAALLTLPRLFREHLEETFDFRPGDLEDRVRDEDGTEKILWRTGGGDRSEAVLVPSGPRRTLCLSTQIGCRMGCAFCRTCRLGLVRNLSALEMLMPLRYYLTQGEPIDNIVFMGMGEPLDNFEALVEALRLLLDPKLFHLAANRVTVSTVGLCDRILDLDRLGLKFRLTVSLTGVTDEQRNSVLPVNRRYPIARLVETLSALVHLKPVVLAFVLIRDFNDGEADIQALARLAKRVDGRVNLLPLNPFPGLELLPPTEAVINRAWQTLTAEGISTRIRWTRGRSILAACGQLGEPANRVKEPPPQGRL